MKVTIYILDIFFIGLIQSAIIIGNPSSQDLIIQYEDPGYTNVKNTEHNNDSMADIFNRNFASVFSSGNMENAQKNIDTVYGYFSKYGVEFAKKMKESNKRNTHYVQKMLENGTLATNNLEETLNIHPIAAAYGWHTTSVLGVVGSLANIFIIHTFYTERDGFTTSVNAMLIMESIHRLGYTMVMIPWRNYNMVLETPLLSSWIGKSEVKNTY